MKPYETFMPDEIILNSGINGIGDVVSINKRTGDIFVDEEFLSDNLSTVAAFLKAHAQYYKHTLRGARLATSDYSPEDIYTNSFRYLS